MPEITRPSLEELYQRLFDLEQLDSELVIVSWVGSAEALAWSRHRRTVIAGLKRELQRQISTRLGLLLEEAQRRYPTGGYVDQTNNDPPDTLS